MAGGDAPTRDRVVAARVVAERSRPNRAATALEIQTGEDGDPSIRMTRLVSLVKSMLATAGSPCRKADVSCLAGSLRCGSLTYMVTGSGDGKPVT